MSAFDIYSRNLQKPVWPLTHFPILTLTEKVDVWSSSSFNWSSILAVFASESFSFRCLTSSTKHKENGYSLWNILKHLTSITIVDFKMHLQPWVRQVNQHIFPLAAFQLFGSTYTFQRRFIIHTVSLWLSTATAHQKRLRKQNFTHCENDPWSPQQNCHWLHHGETSGLIKCSMLMTIKETHGNVPSKWASRLLYKTQRGRIPWPALPHHCTHGHSFPHAFEALD